MQDVATIEAINHDQVVTRTDLLLLRARLQTSTPEGPRSRRTFDFTREAQAALAASRERASTELTVHVRIPTTCSQLVTTAVAFVVTWLGTTLICLLV